MERILTQLTTGWHFGRWLRLGFGLFLTMQAIELRDGLSAFLAAIFLYQAATNSGCCGIGGCSVPANAKKENLPDQETVYEEVK